MAKVTSIYQPNIPMQDHINVDKYEALAYLSDPYGRLLLKKVENEWPRWLHTVAEASWLSHWTRSKLIVGNNRALTPGGHTVDPEHSQAHLHNKLVDVSRLGLQLFIDAVWGFGIEQWLKYPWGSNAASCTKTKNNYPLMISTILKAQGVKSLPLSRKELWDQPIYRGCGLEVPPEFGTLDRWLENLWLEVVEEVEQQKRDKIKAELPTVAQRELRAVAQEENQRAANED